MAKREYDRKIEAVFQNVGMGNTNPEKIMEIIENYERAMITADTIRNRKGKKFKDVLLSAETKSPEDTEEKKVEDEK